MSEEERNTVEETDNPKDTVAAATALTSLIHTTPPPPPEKEQQMEEDEEFVIPERFTRSGRKRAVSFPLKLMKVLSKKELSHIITWLPSGKSFNILNSKRFVAEILPEYFKSSKYSSFTRKLHRWGFARHYRGEEAGAFYHKDFQKGRFDLVDKMSCYKPEPPKPSVPTTTTTTPTSSLPKKKRPVTTELPQHFSDICLGSPKNARMTVTQALRTPTIIAPPPPPQPVAPSSDDLNGLIELEVARRVRETLDAAELRRQALELIQQQEQQRRISSLLRLGGLQQQVPAQTTFGQQHPGISLLRNTALPLSRTHREILGFNKPQNNVATDMQRLPTLPKTNIQGAKTA